MADQIERVVLEAEDSVTPVTSKANASLDAFERKATAAGERQVRVNDQTRSSVQRLITSLEKQADVYGKSGVDKLVAQRDQLLRVYQREPAAIDAITKAYQRMIDVQSKAAGQQFGGREGSYQRMLDKAKEVAGGGSGGSGGGFSARYAFLGIKDVAEGRTTNALAEAANELTRLGGTALAIGGVAAALGGLAVAGWESAKSLGEFATQTNNTSIRMGLTTKEVGQFTFAAKVAGSDIGSLENTMRKLSQSLSDGGEEGKKGREVLRDLGVESRNLDGSVKPMSAVFLQLSERLSGMKDTATRNAEAVRLFGRAGLEVLPAIMALSEQVKRAKELGLGASEEEVRRWEKYHQTITEAEAVWDKLVRKIKEPIAAVVIVTYKFLKSGNGEGPGSDSVAALTYGGGPDDFVNEADVELLRQARADLSGNRGLYAPGFDPARAGTVLSSTMGRVSTAKGFRARMDSGLEGAKSTLQDLKEAYDKAKNSAEALAGSSEMLPEVADKAWQALQKAEGSYKRQSDLVKELEKDESKRVSLLEKSRDLIREGQTFYQIGRGPLATLVTGEQMFTANPTPRGIPSLYRNGASPEVLLAAAEARMQDLKPGMQIVNGELSFVASSSAINQAIGGGEIGQLNARQKAEEERHQQQQRLALSGIGSHADFDVRMTELRAEKDEQIETAETVAGIREGALRRELDLTGDVVKYRESSLHNEMEMRLKIAEGEKKQFETIKGEAASLFDTLFKNPSKFGAQLLGKVRDAFLKPITEGLGGMAASVLQPIIFGADRKSGIAGMLSGIFGGGNKGISDVQLVNGAVPVVIMGTGGYGGSSGLSSLGRMGAIGALATSMAMGGAGRMVGGELIGGGDSTAGLSQNSSGLWMRGGSPLGDLASMAGIGGTGGFAGGYGGPAGGGASGSPLGGILGSLKSLKSTFWNDKIMHGDGSYSTPGDIGGLKGDLAGVLTSKGAASLYLAGGMPLAMAGLAGSRRGTWGGIAESTAGGALVGAGIGTMILPGFGTALGAGIGAAAGFLAGLGEKIAGVESPEREASRLIQQIYGIRMDSTSGTIKQIVQMAQQSFGGRISVAVRSQQVRELIQLYADSTGQKSALLASMQIHSASLAQSGGSLYQQATYANGTPYTYSSPLPTLGPSGSTIPTNNPMGGNVTVHLNPQQTVDLWQTGTAQAIAGDPRGVAMAAGSGNAQSSGRMNAAGLSFDPGAIWS